MYKIALPSRNGNAVDSEGSRMLTRTPLSACGTSYVVLRSRIQAIASREVRGRDGDAVHDVCKHVGRRQTVRDAARALRETGRIHCSLVLSRLRHRERLEELLHQGLRVGDTVTSR
jgi:hypothetical protein